MPVTTRPKRERTQYPGVYSTPHVSRKHGVKPDEYFEIAYRLDGKLRWEGLGWASKRMTASKANARLAEIKENQRTGRGPRTLAEKRAIAKAEDEAKQLEAEREKRRSVTLTEFWERRYWPSQDHKAEGSKTAEKGFFANWIKPALGDKRMSDIVPLDLERIKATMRASNKAPATVKYVFAVFSQVWTLARRDGLVAGDCPTRDVALPQIDNKRLRSLSRDEAVMLLERLKLRTPQSYEMALLALFAGLRFGEIAALTWRDVEGMGSEDGFLTIRDPKSGRNRRAIITKPILAVLEKKAMEGKTGLIFKDTKGGKMERISNVYRQIANELFNQGVTDPRQKVSFHTLRHTFASWATAECKDLYVVSKLLGHADLKMTQRYAHLAQDGIRRAARGIENILEAPATAEPLAERKG